MTLDKEDHKAILIELIDKAHFPGAAVDKVKELRDAILNASVFEERIGPPRPPLRSVSDNDPA